MNHIPKKIPLCSSLRCNDFVIGHDKYKRKFADDILKRRQSMFPPQAQMQPVVVSGTHPPCRSIQYAVNLAVPAVIRSWLQKGPTLIMGLIRVPPR